MLNFREELGKIKELKINPQNAYEKETENIFKKLLQYIDKKDVSDITNGIKTSFEVHNRVIYGYANDDPILLEIFKTNSDAHLTLLYLEDKFIKEGFERISSNTASKDDMFDIMIRT